MLAILLCIGQASVSGPRIQTCPRCHEKPSLAPAQAIKAVEARTKRGLDDASLLWIIKREVGTLSSRGRFERNKKSGAYGLGQFLKGTWKSVGIAKTDCSVCQVEAMNIYCTKRYGSPAKAKAFWMKRRWY